MATTEAVNAEFQTQKGVILQRCRDYEFKFLQGNTLLVANMTDADRAQKAIFESFEFWKKMQDHESNNQWGEALYCCHVFARIVDEEKLASRQEPRLKGQSMKIMMNLKQVDTKLTFYEQQLKASIAEDLAAN